MARGDERIVVHAMPHDFLAQDSGLGDVFRLDALSNFLLVIKVHVQLVLTLLRAPDGLNGVVVGLGDAPMVTLKVRDGLMKIGAQDRKCAQQKTDEQQGPEQRSEPGVKGPPQAWWRRRFSRVGAPLKSRHEYHSEKRATEKKREQGLDIGKVA